MCVYVYIEFEYGRDRCESCLYKGRGMCETCFGTRKPQEKCGFMFGVCVVLLHGTKPHRKNPLAQLSKTRTYIEIASRNLVQHMHMGIVG